MLVCPRFRTSILKDSSLFKPLFGDAGKFVNSAAVTSSNFVAEKGAFAASLQVPPSSLAQNLSGPSGVLKTYVR